MPTNGMTIDGLNTVSSLTAQDKVPVWDNESSGEPTRKITAQDFTNSVKTLGSLVNTTEMNTAIQQSTASFGLVSVLPNASSMPNGIVGFVLSQQITLDGQTLPAGTRFIGYSYNNIAHFVAISNGSIMNTLRLFADNTWTILGTYSGS